MIPVSMTQLTYRNLLDALNIGRNKMAICVECQYVIIYNVHAFDEARCNNSDLCITDFVHGLRECKLLNPTGKCKGFKSKPKPELSYDSEGDILATAKPGAFNAQQKLARKGIYESEEDEKLANIPRDNDNL